jgi:phage/plasmid-associated DNA primase
MRTGRDEHPTLLADLQGRRLVTISETEEEGSLRMEQLKALSGGDPIKARVMRGDYFEFYPTHMLVIATNHRPYVNSTEYAAWRRLRLVPFPFTYKPASEAGEADDRVRDPRLRQRLQRGDTQRSAMLGWLVAGAVDWQRDGLGESATVAAATSEWRLSEDVIANFIEDRLHFDFDAEIGGQDLYEEYRSWCSDVGRPPKANKNFVGAFMDHEMVTTRLVEKVKTSVGAVFRGVGLGLKNGASDASDGYSGNFPAIGESEIYTDLASLASHGAECATPGCTIAVRQRGDRCDDHSLLRRSA